MRKSIKKALAVLSLCFATVFSVGCADAFNGTVGKVKDFFSGLVSRIKGEEEETSYVVEYNTMGGAALANGVYTPGTKLSLPTPNIGSDPEMYGMSFTGWYYDEACTQKVSAKAIDLSYAKDGKLVFYAGWTNVHTIYFDSKTTELIDSQQYAYGDTVKVSDLPVPKAYVVGDRTCEFICWIQANNEMRVTEDFRMQSEDMYFYALYDTGVNAQYDLTEDGYVPLTTDAHTTVEELTLEDGQVLEADMTLPSDKSVYSDDAGIVFAAGEFNNQFDSSLGYVVMFVSADKNSATRSNFGVLDIWGLYTKDGGVDSFGRIARYTFNDVLKGTEYEKKMKAYIENGGETTFRYSIRQNGNTWYLGVDGVEYATLTIGVKHQSGAGAVSETLAENKVVGLRSKTKGVCFSNITVNEASSVEFTFDAGEGFVAETERKVAYDTEIGALPVPTREGYDFDGWYYIKDNTIVDLEETAKFGVSTWKISAYARWTKANANHYSIKFDTGCEDYVVDGVEDWAEGNVVLAPNLEFAFYTYSGVWYYDEARTQVADLNNLQEALADKDGSVITLYAGYTYDSDSDFTNGAWNYDEDTGVYNGLGNTIVKGYEAGVGDTLTVDVTLPIYNTDDAYAGSCLIFGAKDTNVWYRLTIVGNNGSTETHGAIQLYKNNSSSVISGYSVRRMNDALANSSYYLGYENYMNGEGTYTFTLGVIIEDGVFHCLVDGTVVFSYETDLEGKKIGFGSTTADMVTFSNIRVEKTAAKITFNANGGSVTETERTVKAGEKLGTLPTPTKGDVEFKGWYYVADGVQVNVTEETVFAATVQEVTLIARWFDPDASTYTVVFNTGVDGYTIDSLTDWQEGNLITPPTLSDPFHTFDGKWYYDSACTAEADLMQIDASKAVGTTITLYAKATEIEEDFTNSAWSGSEEEYTGTGVTLVKGLTLAEGQTMTVTLTLPAYSTTYAASGVVFGAKDMSSYYRLIIVGNNGTDVKGHGMLQMYKNSSFLGTSVTRASDILANSTYKTAYEAYMTSDETLTVTLTVVRDEGVVYCYVNETLAFTYSASDFGNYAGLSCTTANAVTFTNVNVEDSKAVVTFNAGNGTLTGETTRTIAWGNVLGELPTPTAPEGGEFLGWYLDGEAVTADTVLKSGIPVTITAKYSTDDPDKVEPWDGTASASLKGSGTKEDPYLIANGKDLAFLANKLADTTASDAAAYASAYYKVTANIDLNSKTWTPIASKLSVPFTGVFDGNGMKIMNVNVSGAANIGLFGFVSGATIQNLDLENVSVVSTAATVGGLIGQVVDTANLTTVYNVNVLSGTVSGTDSVGGLIGGANGALTIEQCSNGASVTATTGNGIAGGILGAIGSSGTSNTKLIKDSENTGTVTGVKFVGGIVGLARAATADTAITGCYNYGNVSGTRAGGIVGEARVSVSGCYTYEEATVGGTNASALELVGATADVNATGAIIGRLNESAGGSCEDCGLCDKDGNPIVKTVTITFNVGNGTLAAGMETTLTLNAGSAIGTLPEVTPPENYTFEGWYVDGTLVTAETKFSADTALEARYKEIVKVTITLDTDGGTLDEGTETSLTINEGAAIGELPTPSKDGYTFLGWYNGDEEVTADTTFSESAIVTAKYKENDKVIITLNAGEGSFAENAQTEWQISQGTALDLTALPTPTKFAYAFEGWYYNDTKVDETTTFDADAELVAKYEEAALFEGEGNADSPYLIASAADFKNFATALNASMEKYTAAYYKITATEIDLESAEWTAIGNFAGTLDGNSCEIKNLKIMTGNTVGLFSILSGATVKNLTVNVDITASGGIVGGIAGKTTGDTTIEGCTVMGKISSTGSDVGGIVGTAASANGTITTVKGCSNEANITAVGTTGGIVGAVSDNTKISVEDCKNSGAIEATGSNIGGIVGVLRFDDTTNKTLNNTVKDCYNFGNVKGSERVGGVVGTNRGTVTGCYTLYTVTIESKTGSKTAVLWTEVTTKTPYTGYVIGFNSTEGSANSECGLCDEDGNAIVYITLDVNEGTIDVESTLVVKVGEAGTLPTATKEGYDFLGWYNGETKVESTADFASGCVSLVAQYAAEGGWDGTVSASLSGSGTEAEPYLIANGKDLAFLAKNIADTAYASAYYQLTADIDLSNIAWTPIGTSAAPFKGVFDGQSKTISNLNIEVTTAGNGLFGYIQDATIQNLTVKGNVSGASSTAMIVGVAAASSSSNNLLSGIVAEGTVSSTATDVGGIVGYVKGKTTIKNCENKANITVTSTGNGFVGGIVGDSMATNGVITITGCVNRGNVTAGGTYVGGIIGIARKATGASISDCYNYGNVTGKSTGTVGGIVGCSRVIVENCYTLATATVNGTAASELELNGNYTGDKADSTKLNIGAVIGQVDINGGATEPTGCNVFTLDENGNPVVGSTEESGSDESAE